MLSVDGDAEGGKAAQQAAYTVHLVGAEAQKAGSLDVIGTVIDEDALVGFQLVFVQQRLIDAGLIFTSQEATPPSKRPLKSRSISRASTSSGMLLR